MVLKSYFSLPFDAVIANPLFYPKVSSRGIEWTCERSDNGAYFALFPDGEVLQGLLYQKKSSQNAQVFGLVKWTSIEYQRCDIESFIAHRVLRKMPISEAFKFASDFDLVPPAYHDVYVVKQSDKIHIHRPLRERPIKNMWDVLNR